MSGIVDATALETHRICEGLQAFNRAVVGPIESTPIQLAVKDDAGDVIGGIVGEVLLGWLEIHVLWLRDDARGDGHGAALLRACEERAIGMGAHSSRLDTFDWQAEAFYAHHGYVRFGVLDGYPGTHQRIFMHKPLATR